MTGDFKRRSATRGVFANHDRGLKPTATITTSLCDGFGRRAAIVGSRAFQRPDTNTPNAIRRVATTDPRAQIAIRRSATPDGSRGFQPTDANPRIGVRRGATVEPAERDGNRKELVE